MSSLHAHTHPLLRLLILDFRSNYRQKNKEYEKKNLDTYVENKNFQFFVVFHSKTNKIHWCLSSKRPTNEFSEIERTRNGKQKKRSTHKISVQNKNSIRSSNQICISKNRQQCDEKRSGGCVQFSDFNRYFIYFLVDVVHFFCVLFCFVMLFFASRIYSSSSSFSFILK